MKVAFFMAWLTMVIPMVGWAQGQMKVQDVHIAERISKAEFSNYLNEHKNVQLIDVRTPEEFAQGTIKGAKNINLHDPEFSAKIKALDRSVPVMIFCRSGGRSAQALEQIKPMGFTTVYELEGGYLNWTK